MTEVKVLIEGEHKKVEGGITASSTVVLIKSDKNIIVDTGSFIDGNKIVEALDKEGLKPEDIDIVILTHLHLDHASNVQLFKNAKAYAKHNSAHPGISLEVKSHFIERANLDNFEIAKDVKTILTPGHTVDHISVVVETDKGIIVVTGDAVMTHNGRLVEPIDDNIPCWNIEKLRENRKRIMGIADYIIPGHGGLMEVEKC